MRLNTLLGYRHSIGFLFICIIILVFQWKYIEAPMAKYGGEIITGKYFDLSRGGTITGSIGMGKSTLKLHIMKYLQNQGYRIINFDYKDEMSEFVDDPRKIITPGKNLQINLLDHDLYPSENEVLELFQLIYRNSDQLSPAQQYLLKKGLKRTFDTNGNIENLVDTLIYLGFHSALFDDIFSKMTPLALLNRIAWIFDDLGSIFMTEASNLDLSNTQDLFLNLHYLRQTSNEDLVLTFIEIILQFIIWKKKENEKLVIFVEESQLLFKSQFSRSYIAEIITTLRHSNIAVFLCSTRIDQFPPLLLDTGTLFQFQTLPSYKNPVKSENSLSELERYHFHAIHPGSNYTSTFKVLRFTQQIRIRGKILPDTTSMKLHIDLETIPISILKGMIQQNIEYCQIDTALIEMQQSNLMPSTFLKFLAGKWKEEKYRGSNLQAIDFYWYNILRNIHNLQFPEYRSIAKIFHFCDQLIQKFKDFISEEQQRYLITELP